MNLIHFLRATSQLATSTSRKSNEVRVAKDDETLKRLSHYTCTSVCDHVSHLSSNFSDSTASRVEYLPIPLAENFRFLKKPAVSTRGMVSFTMSTQPNNFRMYKVFR